jgi:hypothetical protein
LRNFDAAYVGLGSKVPESSPVALSQNSAGPPKPDLTVRLLSRIVPALRSASAYFPFPGCASRFRSFAPEPSRGAGRLGPGFSNTEHNPKHQPLTRCADCGPDHISYFLITEIGGHGWPDSIIG